MSKSIMVRIPKRRVYKVQGMYMVEELRAGGQVWERISKWYSHSTSAFAALGRLTQKDSDIDVIDSNRCRVCGCNDDDCSQCVARTGEACHWVELDLCSACAENTALV